MFELLSLLLMRESRIPSYKPTWRCPLYPWVQIVGILCYGFLLVELGSAVLAIAAAILGAALAWYALYAKVRVMRESALVRLAARIASADFRDHDIEAELARVARERDQIVEDPFDRLVMRCPVLDLPGAMSREELFRAVAEDLAPRTHHSPDELSSMLRQREVLSSTVVRPGLAIPHLILEGLGTFQILLIRCREGVLFEEGEPLVRVVFAIAASPEDRNFYLKALVAIAEIAQNPDFDRRWLEAGSAEALREVILAAERRREHGPEG
jgi:mannitol/fructose-specific phosphotransferase system IIA component (Ntr-type)